MRSVAGMGHACERNGKQGSDQRQDQDVVARTRRGSKSRFQVPRASIGFGSAKHLRP